MRTSLGARRALGALVVTGVLLASGLRAQAYVRYQTSTGLGWSWQGTTCLPIVAYPRDFWDMSADEVGTAAMAAAAAWSAAQNPCTYLSLTVARSSDAGPLALPAHQPVLVFREDHWCHLDSRGACGTAPEDVAAYEGNVLVLTSGAVHNKTGAIITSSIEVNGVDFSWADLALHPERGGGSVQDLQNALTHELGHFIGLDHNCAPAGVDPVPLDDHGAPAPNCDAAPAAIQEATMFPTASPGDLAKRTLAADDTQALCDVYPIANDPGRCVPPGPGPEGCACAAAPGAGAPALALAALAAVALLARRRSGR